VKFTILIYRDRTHLQLQQLTEHGVAVRIVDNIHEAREHLDRLESFQAIVVDVQSDVERALEFCDIVHVLDPKMPIIFVRSSQRVSLSPHSATRNLNPDINQAELVAEILDVLESHSTSERKPA
jgi:DNA-binding NtrC family response regulator